VESYDSEEHFDWLLSQIEPKLSILQSRTTEHGWRADIACLWDSQFGHGGPTLSPALLQQLAALGIELRRMPEASGIGNPESPRATFSRPSIHPFIHAISELVPVRGGGDVRQKINTISPWATVWHRGKK
jgi:hypothetical protein